MNSQQYLEILAPAGGPEALTAAIRAGADAVYLGASQFSARSSAHNFDHEQLAQAVQYCHLNGVALHLACNTLVYDEELTQAMSLIEYACSIGVDALIMQDIGLIRLTRQCCPEMPIHGSTQLSVHTPAGVEHLSRLGLTRAVLARELSKQEIQEIAAASPIELEVFVHGALCMSVSGQCYFSAVLGSRSGNRGACAQPCRLPFAAQGGTGHDLSLRDLSLIHKLRELQEMGISSAKIEGRMKRPEYVAAAVAACRESLDLGAVSPAAEQRLTGVFSRSGFTDGYYEGQRGRRMFGIRSKDNVEAADSKLLASVHELYKNERRHIPVDFSLTVQKGQPAELAAEDDAHHRVSSAGAVPEPAQRVALDEERCRRSIEKTGGTPFVLRSLHTEIGEGLSLPGSELNAMRSDCLKQLSDLRQQLQPLPFTKPVLSFNSTAKAKSPKNLRVRLTDCRADDAFLDCELLYVPLFSSDKDLDSLLDRGFALAVEIPRGMFGAEKRIYERLTQVQQLGIQEVLANNIGAVEMAQQLQMDIHGGFGLNLTNSAALEWASQQNILDAEVSFELTLKRIAALDTKLPIGLIGYGRLPLMLTRNCPLSNSERGCLHCQQAQTIRDRKGIDFPVSCQATGCTEILNSVPLSLADRTEEIRGVDFQVLRFSTEGPRQRAGIFQSYIQGQPPMEKYTRGLYYRGSF